MLGQKCRKGSRQAALISSLLCSLHSLLFPDRVVDDLNPVLNFTRREVENLLHFVEEESDPAQLSLNPSKMKESVLQLACLKYPHLITKVRPACFLAGTALHCRSGRGGVWQCGGAMVAIRMHLGAGGNRQKILWRGPKDPCPSL